MLEVLGVPMRFSDCEFKSDLLLKQPIRERDSSISLKTIIEKQPHRMLDTLYCSVTSVAKNVTRDTYSFCKLEWA